MAPVVYPIFVATTYGDGRPHHVFEERNDSYPYEVTRELCAEHLVDACETCGRSPGQHEDLDRQVKAGITRAPKEYGDCGKHRRRGRCGCKLERAQRP